MELSDLAGLPAHPLLVHIPVVLIPLAAIGTVLIVVSARMRERLGWVVAGFAVAGGLGALLAAGAGESLEERLRDQGEPTSRTLNDHTELGDAAQVFSVVFAVVVVAYVVLDHWLRRQARSVPTVDTSTDTTADTSLEKTPTRSGVKKWALPIAAAAAVLTAALATTWIVQAGHSGAKATWEEVNEGG